MELAQYAQVCLNPCSNGMTIEFKENGLYFSLGGS